MDKRFSEMTFPEQLSAYESAMAEASRLKAQLSEYSRKMVDAANQLIAWKDACGLETGGDPDGVTPAKAKEFWDAEFKRVDAFQEQAIELQTDIVALHHDLEVAEHERDEARKELEEWRRAHSQPICNPPEATGAYVDVLGEMKITIEMATAKWAEAEAWEMVAEAWEILAAAATAAAANTEGGTQEAVEQAARAFKEKAEEAMELVVETAKEANEE